MPLTTRRRAADSHSRLSTQHHRGAPTTVRGAAELPCRHAPRLARLCGRHRPRSVATASDFNTFSPCRSSPRLWRRRPSRARRRLPLMARPRPRGPRAPAGTHLLKAAVQRAAVQQAAAGSVVIDGVEQAAADWAAVK